MLVPEIPPWKNLDLDPGPGHDAIRAGVRYFSDRSGPDGPAKVVLVGFSFGCPQAIRAALDPAVQSRVAGVVGFGGYGDLEATVRFGLTGQFLDSGVVRRIRPDPYGRWVVASNYLHRIPGLEEAVDVSDALRELATLAGERKVISWDPVYDSDKDRLEASLPPERRALFRLFAPPSDREPDPDWAAEMAPRLAGAARRIHPGLDAPKTIDAPLPPVHLFHGRHDHLIPWTETSVLAEGLPTSPSVDVTVTGLFSHSEERRSMAKGGREVIRFYRALRRVMDIGG